MKLLFMLCLLFSSMLTWAQSFSHDEYKTPDGKALSITFIKHASLMITYDGHVIQVDPVGEYADYSVFPQAEIVLVTHAHSDHFDPMVIRTVSTSGTQVIANAAVQERMSEAVVMRNGDVLLPNSWLKLEAVAAYNTTPGREKFHPQDGRDNGYILTLGGMRIYVSGDLEDIPELQNIKDIDIAFLPVNQPYTMTVEQANKAVRIVSPRIFYPYHYGETDVKVLKEMLKDSGIEVKIRDLQ